MPYLLSVRSLLITDVNSVQSRIEKEGVIFDPLFTDLGSFGKSGGQKIL